MIYLLKVSIEKKFDRFQLNTKFEARNGITGLIGPSGSGKSVTLQCIAGLQTPDNGTILLNDFPLFDSTNKVNQKTKDRKIGYVFQNYALFPHQTVQKNIEYGLKGFSKQEKNQKLTDMLEKVQLTGFESKYPNQLSGGQQQRVAIARTLVTNPDLLLLDEPFSSLDHHVKHILEQELLRIIKENFSGTVLLVTHNLEEAYRLCDQLIIYNAGAIVQTGEKEEVFKKPTKLSAAIVIGCKNIIAIDSMVSHDSYINCLVGEKKIVAEKQFYSRNTTHLGIYPENIQFVNSLCETENTFSYKVTSVVTGIHHSNLTLKISESCILQALIPNKQLEHFMYGDYKVKLPREHIFLLESK